MSVACGADSVRKKKHIELYKRPREGKGRAHRRFTRARKPRAGVSQNCAHLRASQPLCVLIRDALERLQLRILERKPEQRDDKPINESQTRKGRRRNAKVEVGRKAVPEERQTRVQPDRSKAELGDVKALLGRNNTLRPACRGRVGRLGCFSLALDGVGLLRNSSLRKRG